MYSFHKIISSLNISHCFCRDDVHIVSTTWHIQNVQFHTAHGSKEAIFGTFKKDKLNFINVYFSWQNIVPNISIKAVYTSFYTRFSAISWLQNRHISGTFSKQTLIQFEYIPINQPFTNNPSVAGAVTSLSRNGQIQKVKQDLQRPELERFEFFNL